MSKGGRVSLGEEVLWWGMERAGPKAPLSQQGAGLGTNASLAQMVSGLVGQLLMQPVLVGESSFFPHTSEISVADPPSLTSSLVFPSSGRSCLFLPSC